MTKHNPNAWVDAAKANGWADFARSGLDALAPLGPLGAQLVWISQPFLSLFVRREALANLAETLESAEGLAGLCAQLDEDEGDPHTAGSAHPVSVD